MVYLLAINTGLLLAILFQRQARLHTLETIRRIVMSVSEDLATLTGKFDSMEEAVAAVAEDIAALKQEIIDANQGSNVDLTPLIARAEGIEARLRAAAGSNPGSDDEPEV